MEIELRIIRDPYAELPKQQVRVFGEAGGGVGRSSACYWVLPDPRRFLSGQHCRVYLRDGAFWVRDTSVNGVFVNGSSKPLGFGREVRLAHGDEIKFASYTARVNARTAGKQDSGSPDDDVSHQTSLEPEELHAEAFAATMVDESQRVSQALAQEDIPAAPAAAAPAPAPTLDPRTVHVDIDRLQGDGLVPSRKMERLLSNQFRHIKRPVINNALGRGREPVPNARLVMVTSSLPGEGKTFSSLNLALSIAREKDLDVVLIDADAPKATMSRIFGLQEAPGLLNALADDSIDVESLILPTDIKGLGLLPAGQCEEEDIATELLASARMNEVVARIDAFNAHRIALFDSPPLLVTNEARVLASLMGQILLVVRAGVTPQQAVLEAIRYLDEEKPLGLLLNQSKGHSPGSYYGYGGYGYGLYGAEDNSGKTGVEASAGSK